MPPEKTHRVMLRIIEIIDADEGNLSLTEKKALGFLGGSHPVQTWN